MPLILFVILYQFDFIDILSCVRLRCANAHLQVPNLNEFMMPDRNDDYFRVRYKKLDSPCKLSNGLRSDLKFDIDANNTLVFSLYPEFETLSDKAIVGNEWEALDEGTAIIRKPYWEYSNDYFDILSSRVNVGAKACLVAGSHQIAELEIIEIINQL